MQNVNLKKIKMHNLSFSKLVYLAKYLRQHSIVLEIDTISQECELCYIRV